MGEAAPEGDARAAAFAAYLDAIRQARLDEKTEHSDRAALENLMGLLAADGVRVQHEPTRQGDKGSPDFKLTRAGRTLGFVEVKKVGEDLTKVARSAQIKKYRTLTDNLILTDYVKFVWLKTGEVVRLAEAEDVAPGTKGGPAPAAADAVAEMFAGFTSEAPERIGKASDLAEALAHRCRLLRDALTTELTRQDKEDEKGQLHGLYEKFKTNVFADLKLKEFADAFAQTLGYGLFLAKFNADTKEMKAAEPDLFGQPITLTNAKKFIPRTFELIRELVNFLDVLEDNENYAPVRWVVEEIVSLINGLDVAALHEDLSFRGRKVSPRGNRTRSEEEARLFERDPYIYFYEDFLAAYDAETHKKRGVFYTPPPVVSFIVRAVDDILQDTFGIEDGLADQERVTVLDFACGTGTFLLEVFQQVLAKLPADSARTDGVIREHLLRNVFGFEFLIAPYTIAHLKLSQYLEDKGHKLTGKERLQVLLANTLEPIDVQSDALLPALSSEAKKAQAVKKSPILVITGNPPYYGESRNMGKHAKSLVERYKYVDGHHFKEKKHWLQNDYVKFISFAQGKIEKAGRGLLAIVVDHSWIENPTFRGMRQQLYNSFDTIQVIDLHGNVLRREVSPDGSIDEGVFPIMQGTCILLASLTGAIARPVPPVSYDSLWGRKLQKFQYLSRHDRSAFAQRTVRPETPFYLFHRSILPSERAYGELHSVTDIFDIYRSGYIPARTALATAFTKKDLEERSDVFLALDVEDARHHFKLNNDSQDWSVSRAQKSLGAMRGDKDRLISTAYRVLDDRYTFWNDEVGGFNGQPVPEANRHIYANDNQVFVFHRREEADIPYNHFWVTDRPTEHSFMSSKTTCYTAPLHLYNGSERVENLQTGFRRWIDRKYDTEFEAEDIFNYIYGVTNSGLYRSSYREYLRIDFPRIPFPDDPDHFETLARLGSDLVQAHLLRANTKGPLGQYLGKGDHEVQRRDWVPSEADPETGALWINETQRFEPVPKAVHQFVVGGYQVLDKYLKDRRGRTLSQAEYDRITAICNVLSFTIAKMDEIDVAYRAAFPELVPDDAAGGDNA